MLMPRISKVESPSSPKCSTGEPPYGPCLKHHPARVVVIIGTVISIARVLAFALVLLGNRTGMAVDKCVSKTPRQQHH